MPIMCQTCLLILRMQKDNDMDYYGCRHNTLGFFLGRLLVATATKQDLEPNQIYFTKIH